MPVIKKRKGELTVAQIRRLKKSDPRRKRVEAQFAKLWRGLGKTITRFEELQK